jgi:hypothetical protein
VGVRGVRGAWGGSRVGFGLVISWPAPVPQSRSDPQSVTVWRLPSEDSKGGGSLTKTKNLSELVNNIETLRSLPPLSA